MMLQKKHGLAATCAVAAFVIVRANVVAANCPDGWEILRDRLVAGLPPILADHQSSGDRFWFRPKQQLLDPADRLGNNPNATADQCMGMAWALAGGMGSTPNPAIVGRLT